MMKFILKFILVLFVSLILYSIVKLNHSTTFEKTGDSYINIDVYKQLQHLKSLQGEDAKLQTEYPEGYLFFNAIYLLTWYNTIRNLQENSKQYKEGQNEISLSCERLFSEKGKSTFHENIVPKYGAFYNGWLAYCLSKKIEVDHKENHRDIVVFDSLCNVIYNAYATSPTKYIESYYEGSWPVDNIVCIAALHRNEVLFEKGKYTNFVNNWIDSVFNSKGKLSLIKHHVESKGDRTIIDERASSNVLAFIFLHEMNPRLSSELYPIFKAKFYNKRLTRLGIREYPLNIKGDGDIDSGPVIWDIGAVASIVGMQTAYLHNDVDTYKNLMRSVELFGIPYSYRGKKKYLFGKLTIADVFIAWSRSVERN